MDSGLYAAYTGLLARTQALDTAANNLANTPTWPTTVLPAGVATQTLLLPSVLILLLLLGCAVGEGPDQQPDHRPNEQRGHSDRCQGSHAGVAAGGCR